MTDIEGFLTIYGHSDNLLNNNPGYPQEDIIILSNKGSVTVSQKRREERGSGLRTQGRTICLEGMQGKIWRYLQEARYK